jgi:hypothetical protein
MPGGTRSVIGNELFTQLLYLSGITVPTVLANASATQTVTVNGVAVGDLVSWNQQGVVAGLSIDNVYVSAANTLSFYWSNTTIGSLGPTTTNVIIEVARSENYNESGTAGFPTSIT